MRHTAIRRVRPRSKGLDRRLGWMIAEGCRRGKDRARRLHTCAAEAPGASRGNPTRMAICRSSLLDSRPRYCAQNAAKCAQHANKRAFAGDGESSWTHRKNQRDGENSRLDKTCKGARDVSGRRTEDEAGRGTAAAAPAFAGERLRGGARPSPVPSPSGIGLGMRGTLRRSPRRTPWLSRTLQGGGNDKGKRAAV